MRTFLKRLILVLIVAIVAFLVWEERDRIGLLTNNGLRIKGTWYQVEMGFKTSDSYQFSDRLIDRNGELWGSYELRMNTRLEVTTNNTSTDYRLEFENEENMVWLIEVGDRWVPSLRWRR